MKKDPLKKISVCMLCFIMLASVFMLSACSKDDSTNPFHEFITDSQKLKLEQLAEAFAEGGYNFSSSTPISFMDMEKFIYFYYNDKVIADEDSKLASLDEETASDFVTATFGTGGNELHYNFGEIGGETRFYFDKESGNYMIMPSDSYALRSEVTSVEKKDGKLIANVEIDGTDETSCIMYLEFSVKSDTIQVLACVRYDIS